MNRRDFLRKLGLAAAVAPVVAPVVKIPAPHYLDIETLNSQAFDKGRVTYRQWRIPMQIAPIKGNRDY